MLLELCLVWQLFSGVVHSVVATSTRYPQNLVCSSQELSLQIQVDELENLTVSQILHLAEERSSQPRVRSPSSSNLTPDQATSTRANISSTATPMMIGLMATHQRKKLLAERSLPSMLRQTHALDCILIVSDDWDGEDPTTESDITMMKEAFAHGNNWSIHTLPRIHYLQNRRTRGASGMGAWNTGIMYALAQFGSDCWVATLDDDDEWMPDHIKACLSARGAAPSPDTVEFVATMLHWLRPEGQNQRLVVHSTPVPAALPLGEEFLLMTGIQGSNFFVRMQTLLKSGCGDEAMLSPVDKDLAIRIVDLLHTTGSHAYTSTEKKTVRHYAEDLRVRTSNPGSVATAQGVRNFYYKYAHRMSPAIKERYAERVRDILGCTDLNLMCEDDVHGFASVPSSTYIRTQSGDTVAVSACTHKSLVDHGVTVGSGKVNLSESSTPTENSSNTVLFGVISSSIERLTLLLDDISAMRRADHLRPSVLIFANSVEPTFAAAVEHALNLKMIPGFVIRSSDVVVNEVLASYCGDGHPDSEKADATCMHPLPIAQSRTVLQSAMRTVAHAARTKLGHTFLRGKPPW